MSARQNSRLTLKCYTFQSFHSAEKCDLRLNPRHVVARCTAVQPWSMYTFSKLKCSDGWRVKLLKNLYCLFIRGPEPLNVETLCNDVAQIKNKGSQHSSASRLYYDTFYPEYCLPCYFSKAEEKTCVVASVCMPPQPTCRTSTLARCRYGRRGNSPPRPCARVRRG